MAFHNPASKFERALRAYLIAQGKATQQDTFISNDSRTRTVLPNRTIQVATFDPTRGHRPEGQVHVLIQHVVESVEQAGDEGTEVQRLKMDEFLGATLDSMSGGDPQSLERIADAITAAGRALAVTDGSEPSATQAARNTDMANFRCDWIKQAHPLITRGRRNDDPTNWNEDLNYTAFVSPSTAAAD